MDEEADGKVKEVEEVRSHAGGFVAFCGAPVISECSVMQLDGISWGTRPGPHFHLTQEDHLFEEVEGCFLSLLLSHYSKCQVRSQSQSCRQYCNDTMSNVSAASVFSDPE